MNLKISNLWRSNNSNKLLGGRYKIIGKLGEGGFGETFIAVDMHLPDRPKCVVKQLKPQINDSQTWKIAKRLFDQEAQVLYRLGKHGQIPQLLAHFEEDKQFYLAQEIIEGETLDEELIEDRPWSEGQVIGLLLDLLRTLSFVHREKVIHRDIKPPNIIRRQPDGKIVLIDFGAVKQVTTQLANTISGQTTKTVSIGTQGYTSPEQLTGNPRFSSDVYAVGKIAIQALTGIHPRYLSQDSHSGGIEWDRNANGVSPQLKEILDRMVCYDFRERYPTSQDALSAVENLPQKLLNSVPSPQSLPKNTKTSISKKLDNSSLDLSDTIVSKSYDRNLSHTSPTIWQQQRFKVLLLGGSICAVGAVFLMLKGVFTGEPVNQLNSENKLSNPEQSARDRDKDTTPLTEQSAPVPDTQPTKQQQVAKLLQSADKQRVAGSYQQAINLYDKAIALAPQLARAEWGRCYSFNKLQQYQNAINACDRALEIKPNYPLALSGKGYALVQQNQYEQALALFDRAIKLNPQFVEALNNKGQVLGVLERFPEALASFNQAIEIDRNNYQAWRGRGVALFELGKRQQGIESLQQALKINPNDKYAQQLLKRMQRI
ncbi:MAG: serine/threonine-protein kinase [Prochloraceae cyanobacterium]|nr:serine/threonine-protein kinase [Prochloraceae cyanobacterium]